MRTTFVIFAVVLALINASNSYGQKIAPGRLVAVRQTAAIKDREELEKDWWAISSNPVTDF